MYKSKNGITLIALVITIIVLLILAGVSIAMLTGENGLLTKASESKTKTTNAEIIERTKLGIAEQVVEKNGAKITKEELATILNDYFQSVNASSIPDNVSTTNDLDLRTLEGNETIKLSSIYTGGFETETYGLRADGKFYCNPSTFENSPTNYERTQTGIVYDSNHYYFIGSFTYTDMVTGERITVPCYKVWDGDSSSFHDIFDENGRFIKPGHDYL